MSTSLQLILTGGALLVGLLAGHLIPRTSGRRFARAVVLMPVKVASRLRQGRRVPIHMDEHDRRVRLNDVIRDRVVAADAVERLLVATAAEGRRRRTTTD